MMSDIFTINQSGGSNVVNNNYGNPPRILNKQAKQQLDLLVTGKTQITVTAILGDTEAFNFADQILQYLKSKLGEDKVHGVNQAVYSGVVKGQNFNPETNEFVIGANIK